VWRRLLEAFFAVVLEESLRAFLPHLLPYAWLAILTLLTIEILNTDRVKHRAVSVFRCVPWRYRMLSYVVVAAVGAGLLSFYWWGIQKAFAVIAPQQVSEPKSRPEKGQPSSASIQQPQPKARSVFDSTVADWRLENQPENLELHDLFLTDFKSVPQQAYGAIFVDDAKTISVQYSINVELAQRTKFLAFYIPRQEHTAEICQYLSNQYNFVLDKAPQLLIEQKVPGESSVTSTKEAVFSKRIFIYNETYLSEAQTVKLTEIYRNLGASVIFRGIDYLANKKLEATVKKLRLNPAS